MDKAIKDCSNINLQLLIFPKTSICKIAYYDILEFAIKEKLVTRHFVVDGKSILISTV